MTERVIICVARICPVCDKISTVCVYQDEYETWLTDKTLGGSKRHIEVAMPEMSLEDREILITGTHPKCWDDMWKEEEE